MYFLLLNKTLDVLTNKLFKSFPPYPKVDPKVEVVPRLVPPSKATYIVEPKGVKGIKGINKQPPTTKVC
jgi:hypothetical protein